MSSVDVIPASNLSPKSLPWGRRLENSIRATTTALGGLTGRVGDQNRNNATNVAALGSRIIDLQARSSYYSEISLATTAVAMPTQFTIYTYSGSVSIPVPLPPDGEPRNSLIFVSCYAYNDAAPVTMSGITVLTLESPDLDRTLSSGLMANPIQTSTPPNWMEAEYMSGAIVPSGSNVTLNFGGNVSRNSPTPFTVNIGVQNINTVVIYGEKIA